MKRKTRIALRVEERIVVRGGLRSVIEHLRKEDAESSALASQFKNEEDKSCKEK